MHTRATIWGSSTGRAVDKSQGVKCGSKDEKIEEVSTQRAFEGSSCNGDTHNPRSPAAPAELASGNRMQYSQVFNAFNSTINRAFHDDLL